jgi:pimeloyl-ACP methyl ester carboxylesterase
MANVNGINMSYKIEGAGEPLVLIGGLNSNKGAWRSQVRSFKKFYRTITFDNRGAGKSDKPLGPYTIRMMADDAVGLMDHLGIGKAVVIGYSMGGMIAQELSINHPERVSKLVLGSTWARTDEKSGPSAEFDKAVEDYERSSHDRASERRLARAFLDLAFNRRLYRAFILPIMKVVIRFVPLPASGAEQAKAAGEFDAVDRLGTIKAPALVICGTDDRLIKPTSSDVIASVVPRAKLIKVPGGGHNFPLEMSGEFNREVLDFLRI